MGHNALVLKLICNIGNIEALNIKTVWVEISLLKFLTTRRIKKYTYFFLAIGRMTFQFNHFFPNGFSKNPFPSSSFAKWARSFSVAFRIVTVGLSHWYGSTYPPTKKTKLWVKFSLANIPENMFSFFFFFLLTKKWIFYPFSSGKSVNIGRVKKKKNPSNSASFFFFFPLNFWRGKKDLKSCNTEIDDFCRSVWKRFQNF